MDNLTGNTRIEQIPVLHVRGTHFAVGFTIGRQFRYMIEDVLEKSEFFNQQVLPSYETDEGKRVYESSLAICTQNFPQYLQELEGIAKGANIPFFKLFLYNLEFFVTPPEDCAGESRCSDIMINSKNMVMGHNEDTGPELLNNVFIVCAEIIGDGGLKLEKFTSFTYAACLPGYTMGFNDQGFVHTINTLCPVQTAHGTTPRNFLARALLPASNLDQALEILKNKGGGLADGFSINMHFANQQGTPMMYNVEVSPNPDSDENRISVYNVNPGQTYVHCNRFLHLDVPELPRATIRSSRRHQAIDNYPKPQNVESVMEILSDQSDSELPVFRMQVIPTDNGNTVAVGIFDITNRKWNIFIDPPIRSKPVVVIPMDF